MASDTLHFSLNNLLRLSTIHMHISFDAIRFDAIRYDAQSSCLLSDIDMPSSHPIWYICYC